MDKTEDVSLRGNRWQRLVRWHRTQGADGEGGLKDGENPDTHLGHEFKIK